MPGEPIETRIVPVDPGAPDAEHIAQAAAVIRGGGLVAFPTETVYGLGANALDETAVRRIFEAKGRDENDPLIVHIGAPEDLENVVAHVPATARWLARVAWPGPLTMVLPRNHAVPGVVSAGRETVAVRMPSHPVALGLIRAARVPIAAPSANRFMRTSATDAAHVYEDLGGRIEMILDGGPAYAGIESTVVAFEGDHVSVLRPGAVSREWLEGALDREVEVRDRATAGPAMSPGTQERHYAPRAKLLYLPGETVQTVVDRARAERRNGGLVGVVLADEDAPGLEDEAGFAVARLGRGDQLDAVGRRLFAALRELDRAGVRVIIARGFPREGTGLAIDDRLRRASTPKTGH